MPGFADSFWTPDYVSGLEVLYEKLQQGVVENKQILTIVSMRADAEEQYSVKLGGIAPAVDKLTPNGFSKDDGASVRKVGRLLTAPVHSQEFLTWAVWLLQGIRRCTLRDGRSVQEAPEDCIEYSRACRDAVQPMERTT